jgi:GAF domain-containing protein
MAALLLGWRQALLYTFLSIIGAFGMAMFEGLGVMSYTPKSAFGISIEGTVLFIFGGIFLYLIINSLESAIKKEKIDATALQSTNQYLSEMRNALEKRVEERTKVIEAEQTRALRRSRQFEGIARVSRAISNTRNLQEVLPQITQVISEQFDFYHVGIFLNDAVNQYAILSAANSEGGKRMLDRGHQLKIGEQGIVGFVTGSGTPRIALDVGTDNVYFNNPDLPLTHSEMALPLKSGNEIIGALDIQSIEQNAFSDDDVEVLESLADQVSLAIQNTRLFDQTNKLLSEAEAIQKQYQKNTWGRLSREKKLTGYKYTITGASPLDEAETEFPQSDRSKREVSVPISLRGENIGTLIVQLPYSERVNADQMDLIKAVAERVALSAENARLFEETNRRAEREQVISDIASKISTSVHTENILKTTAKELNQILNGAEVLIKLGNDRNQ